MLDFCSILKSGKRIAIRGTKEYTGAYFEYYNEKFYSYNRHVDLCCMDDCYGENTEKELNEHLENMIKEGFVIIIGLDFDEYKTIEGGR